MYRSTDDLGQDRLQHLWQRPHGPIQGNMGKKIKLQTNSFAISMNPGSHIYHYKYTLNPPANNSAEDVLSAELVWAELKALLGVFVVNSPRNIFTPKFLADFSLTVPAAPSKNFTSRQMNITMFQSFAPDQVNAGVYGQAAVVLQHIVKKLADPVKFQKVGRRYYNPESCDPKSLLQVFSGFHLALNCLSDFPALLQIDTMSRIVHKKTVIDTITGALEGQDCFAFRTDDEVADEWRRRCTNATVVSQYNNRAYQVKTVRFDMNPGSFFELFAREEKTSKQMTFAQYYHSYYAKEIVEPLQPLLEAYAEKQSERVFLLPELCSLTGFSDEIRRDKQQMLDALRIVKVGPGERFAAVCSTLTDILARPPSHNSWETGSKLLESWKLGLSRHPTEVEARVIDSLEVNFGTKKYPIEEGNFHRWMRNGLQCPVRLEDWVFIYPEMDVPVLDIWLRSLRDIASVAFGMKMADPKRHSCTDQRKELVPLLQRVVTPRTQLVLLLTPNRDCRTVYRLFKEATCTQIPCISQVVKSETIRKRQSIAAVLSRIVLQINAKFAGPLWHVDLAVDSLKPLFTGPIMIIGIDIYKGLDGKRWMGFAASIDTMCSEYYSTAAMVDAGPQAAGATDSDRPAAEVHREAWRSVMANCVQVAMKEALEHFSRHNDGLLPEHVVVYRASLSYEEWDLTISTELEGLKEVLKYAASKVTNGVGEPYNPHFTFIAIARKHGTRFFAPVVSPSPTGQGTQINYRNPDPGTVVDTTGAVRPEQISFFLVNHVVAKGTANPTQFTVLHDTANLTPNALQGLSYRLSFMYYNFTGSVKLPAPAQYAKKVAHFVGTAVRAEPHQRLLSTFFYL